MTAMDEETEIVPNIIEVKNVKPRNEDIMNPVKNGYDKNVFTCFPEKICFYLSACYEHKEYNTYSS